MPNRPNRPKPEGVPPLATAVYEALPAAQAVVVHGEGAIGDHLEQAARAALAARNCDLRRVRDCGWTGLAIDAARLMLTDGRSASDCADALGVPDVAVFDRPLAWPLPPAMPLAYALAEGSSEAWRRQAAAWLAGLGFTPLRLADAPGLVVARTVAMLINEAADAVQQGACTPEGADTAMKLGVNYPAGPFEWLAQWAAADVVALLDALDNCYRGESYRVSPWLRRRARAAR